MAGFQSWMSIFGPIRCGWKCDAGFKLQASTSCSCLQQSNKLLYIYCIRVAASCCLSDSVLYYLTTAKHTFKRSRGGMLLLWRVPPYLPSTDEFLFLLLFTSSSVESVTFWWQVIFPVPTTGDPSRVYPCAVGIIYRMEKCMAHVLFPVLSAKTMHLHAYFIYRAV